MASRTVQSPDLKEEIITGVICCPKKGKIFLNIKDGQCSLRSKMKNELAILISAASESAWIQNTVPATISDLCAEL